MKKIFTLFLILFSLNALADPADWFSIGVSNGRVWEGLKGSGKFVKTVSGKNVFVATVRDTMNDKTTYEQIYVDYISDCPTGSGKLTATDMAGNVVSSIDFVLAGSTVGDTLARTLCSSAMQALKPAPTIPPAVVPSRNTT